MSDFILHVDQDGVLADFQLGYVTQTNIPWHIATALPDNIFWDNVNKHPDFFYELPLMPDALELWDTIKHLDPRILTAIPRVTTRATTKDEKRRYITKYFGEHVIVNFSPSAQDKVKFYRPGTRDVLIDDRKDTIETWNKAGGIGIHHTSAKNTIQQLMAFKVI